MYIYILSLPIVSCQDHVVQFLDLSLGNGNLELHDVHDIQPVSLVVERLSSIPIISTVADIVNVCYLPGNGHHFIF
jgi:hypothetical protein